ncbi:MAG: Gfo/Idh/MocA family oxidoreductase [Chloroflexi bacterium]|nr:Gfo/Idh/MocA family oxidoreductase [Chloroflexota bacterium]
MVGIALLGAGFAGKRQLECWQRVPEARVVGLWNRTAERGRAAAQRFGVPFYPDLEDLLADLAVDAVDIATTPETHLAFTRQASAHGKPVLCQKPLADSYDESEAIVSACERAGVRLMANENFRWRPWYRVAKQVVRSGALGDLFHLRLTYRDSLAVATAERPAAQVFDDEPYLKKAERLVLIDMGPHNFDIVRFLFGDPETVYARAHKVTPFLAGEEVATALLGYPGRTAVVEASFASIGYPPGIQSDELIIEGREGTLRLGWDGQLTLRRRLGGEERFAVDVTDYRLRAWTAALAHFVECLRSGAPFETPGRDYLKTMRFVFAAYESAETGLPVRAG